MMTGVSILWSELNEHIISTGYLGVMERDELYVAEACISQFLEVA